MKLMRLTLLLAVLFCCCKKSSTPTIKQDPLVYTASYDSVIQCYALEPYTFPFGVNVLSGDIGLNRVTFEVTGLPSEITVEQASQSVGYVQGGSFKFSVGNMPVGYDTVGLVISAATYGSQHHKLIFHVQKPIDYAPFLAGTYSHSFDFCEPDSFTYYTSVATMVTDTPYLLKISNIKNLGTAYKVRATVSKLGVTIPVQAMGPYTIWGSGTFSKDTANHYQVQIKDTLVHGTDTDRCTIHLIR